MRTLILACAVTLIAAPAASIDRPGDAERFAKATAGFTAGAPKECLDRRDEQGFTTAGSKLIFRYGAKLLYVNETRGGCEGASRRDAIVVNSGISRLCRGDVARAVDSRTGVESGICTLGKFVPYTRN